MRTIYITFIAPTQVLFEGCYCTTSYLVKCTLMKLKNIYNCVEEILMFLTANVQRYCSFDYSSPRRFAYDTIITFKCLDILNLSKCFNYNIVHTVKNEGTHLYTELALVLINFILINFYVINSLNFFLLNII